VIVRAPGIVGKAATTGVGDDVGRRRRGGVVEANDDQRAHAGQDHVQVAAAGQPVGPGQIAHLAVAAGGDPRQVGIQPAGRRGGDDAGAVEAQRRRLGLQFGRESYNRRCHLGQMIPSPPAVDALPASYDIIRLLTVGK